MKMLERLAQPVPERDFLNAHKAVIEAIERDPRERSMERTMGILCDHFPRKSGKPAQVMFRMQALAEIWEHPLMKAWKEDGLPDGGALIDEVVFRVAARHPVSTDEDRWYFEPESFFREVLRRAGEAGTA
jgi:hypothetical protein